MNFSVSSEVHRLPSSTEVVPVSGIDQQPNLSTCPSTSYTGMHTTLGSSLYSVALSLSSLLYFYRTVQTLRTLVYCMILSRRVGVGGETQKRRTSVVRLQGSWKDPTTTFSRDLVVCQRAHSTMIACTTRTGLAAGCYSYFVYVIPLAAAHHASFCEADCWC